MRTNPSEHLTDRDLAELAEPEPQCPICDLNFALCQCVVCRQCAGLQPDGAFCHNCGDCFDCCHGNCAQQPDLADHQDWPFK